MGKTQKEPGDLHHAVVFIHDHHAARPHDGTDTLNGIVIDGQVQKLGGHTAAGGSTHLDGLKRAAFRYAAADVENYLLDRGSDGNFHQAGVDYFAGQGKNLGALAVGGADFPVPVGPVFDDQRHIGPGFDVVDIGGFVVDTGLGRKRRPGPGHAALAFNGGHQGGFLAADEGTGTQSQ